MKKTYFILMLIFFNFSNGQTRIQFFYDNAGNQIQRKLCTSCAARESNGEMLKDSESITEQDMLIDEEFNDIKFYPNPVKGELYLSWKKSELKTLESIQIYSLNGQILKSIENLNNKDLVTINFSDYPVGYYSIILIYNNGEKKDLKIIKE